MSFEFDFILNVSLSTISKKKKNWIYIKRVSLRDTFHNCTKFNMS